MLEFLPFVIVGIAFAVLIGAIYSVGTGRQTTLREAVATARETL